jgi:hypothetical protein
LSLVTAGDTAQELLTGLGGKAQVEMREGGRLGLDLRTLAQSAKRGDLRGWHAAGTSTTGLDQLALRLDVHQGVLHTKILQAKSGTSAFTGAGSIDLIQQALEFAVAFETTDPSIRPAAGSVLVLNGPWAAPSVRVEHRDEAVQRPAPAVAPVLPASRP